VVRDGIIRPYIGPAKFLQKVGGSMIGICLS
jgi:hypothetical protein